MARYAIVKNEIVNNIVEYDGVSEFSVDGDLIADDGNAYLGGSYSNGAFTPRPVPEDIATYSEKRQLEYPSINDLIVALWENVIEERAASVIELEAKRQDVKTKYPKS